MDPKYSNEYGLMKPDYADSIAGVFSSAINGLQLNDPIDLTGRLRSPKAEKVLAGCFPSGYKNIVLFLVDAVGAIRLEQMKKSQLAAKLQSQGTTLSSVFPSVTSAVMSSLSTSLPPALHGVPGYNTFNEHLGGLYNALNLKHRGKNWEILDAIATLGDRSKLISGQAGSQLVKEFNKTRQDADHVHMAFLEPKELTGTGLSKMLFPELQTTVYDDLKHAVSIVHHILNSSKTPSIVAVYIGFTDQVSHMEGPNSTAFEKAVIGAEKAIQMVAAHPSAQDGTAAVVMTSDHGQVDLGSSAYTRLDEEKWKKLMSDGVMVGNSGRVLHAYCQPDAVDLGKMTLETLIGDHGMVVGGEEAMRLAGSDEIGRLQLKPDQHNHAQRMGDWVAIMDKGFFVDVPEIVPFGTSATYKGQHGSLTPEEMLVPFVVANNFQ